VKVRRAMSTSTEDCQIEELRSKYKIMHKIGDGSYGVVRRAKNRRTNELVAVKLLGKENHPDARLLVDDELLINESVDHPNIVQYIE